MGLFLIHEKANPKSFYNPWLSILPEKIPSSLLFDEADMEHLKGSMLQSITTQRRAALASEYKQVMEIMAVNHSALFPKDVFTEEAYTWATCVVASRSLSVNAGNTTVPILVPFADLATHHHAMNTTFDFDEDNNFKVITNTPINNT